MSNPRAPVVNCIAENEFQLSTTRLATNEHKTGIGSLQNSFIDNNSNGNGGCRRSIQLGCDTEMRNSVPEKLSANEEMSPDDNMMRKRSRWNKPDLSSWNRNI